VPERIFGRVTSVYRLFGEGAISVGALLGGLLSASFGLTAPFWVAASVLTVLAFAALPVVNTGLITAAQADSSVRHRRGVSHDG